ncbi:MAG: hypothetical protein ACXAC7_09210 [Candidatus Hodarchaeales archaeon]|jgi:small-conductance mechanosensitive channel
MSENNEIKYLENILEQFSTEIGENLNQFEEKITFLSQSVLQLEKRLEQLEKLPKKDKLDEEPKPKKKHDDLLDALKMIDS